MASPEDIKKLSEVLDIPAELLESQLSGFPNRGSTLDMPPKDPTIYRLYEIVQNYGQAYKAVLHEKFGDGIMSAISFSTKIEKETDEKGEWAKITLRGKWFVVSGCNCEFTNVGAGCPIRDSRYVFEENWGNQFLHIFASLICNLNGPTPSSVHQFMLKIQECLTSNVYLPLVASFSQQPLNVIRRPIHFLQHVSDLQ